MADGAPLTALGLMSGTSLDGVDAALLRTDGEAVDAIGPTLTLPYDDHFRARLRAQFGRDEAPSDVVRDLTERHAEAVHELVAAGGAAWRDVDVIGFHGQTIVHRPEQGVTRQIGDGALLARRTGIPVVDDFRSRDVAAGGQGAPLAPLYHAALARHLIGPVCVLNVGGVANLTWIGGAQVIAFDTGPGVALLDDWIRAAAGRPMDEDGALAAAGRAHAPALAALLADPYFERTPPKSLDRNHFDATPLAGLGAADGAATLVAFTAAAVGRARAHLPAPPARWLVCGGGRRNPLLMTALAEAVEAPLAAVEEVGWDGDALEAQAFAYLAVGSLRGLALSLPRTTGVGAPTTGGTLHTPPGAAAA